jgi:hypothetical protein
MNPNHNRKRGKTTERQLAKRLGGRRVGLMGKDDIVCDPFSIEVKDRQKFAGEVFMQQSERNAAPYQTPIVIVHITGQPHDKDIVLMRLKEFEAWHGLPKKL